MCGIAGIVLQPRKRHADQWRAIYESFTCNLIFNEERGKAATGVAVTGLNGQVKVYKTALSASQFVHTRDYQKLMRTIDSKTVLLLGHTRLPTKGDPRNNSNNHPVQAGSVLGVHNGEITNDDALFVHSRCQRSAEVDSEIIFRLIEGVDPGRAVRDYLGCIRERLGLMQGQYTFLAWDRRKPERVLALRHGNPLCMHYQPEWNALVFSSRYIFLRKSFGTSLVEGPLPHDLLMLFDATRLTELAGGPSNITPLCAWVSE